MDTVSKAFEAKTAVENAAYIIEARDFEELSKKEKTELIRDPKAQRKYHTKNFESKLNEIIEAEECFSIKDLAINGKDLIALGVKPGKDIGIILNKLLEKVIEDPDLNNRESLIAMVKQIN